MKTLIGLITLSLSVVASVYLLTTAYTQTNKAKEINECMKIAQVQTTINQGDQKQTFSQPHKEWYDTCMKAKGYK